MNLKSFSLRWLWLGAGIAAIIGLTALNVYSIYQLRNNSVEAIRKSKILQVGEFADRVRHRFIHPFEGLAASNINAVENIYKRTGRFTDKVIEEIYEAAGDSIFSNIYFISAQSSPCYNHEPILVFEAEEREFISTRNYGAIVCDALGIARTRMKVLIEGYTFNNKVFWDTQRSFIIALVNVSTESVFGYLIMPINRRYLLSSYLQPKLEQAFGGPSNKGITVWLRYWPKNEVLASSDPEQEYNRDNLTYIHQFSDFFDDWGLYVAMNESLLADSDGNSFVLNLVVLGVAFILLIGALIFMFATAQRERSLAKRQSNFLANVTHELKTPLAVMQAAGENLADGRIHNKYRLKKYGSHIYSETLRLRKMIEKLLDVAKADAGKSFVKPEPCAIDLLLTNFIDEHREYIEYEGFTTDIYIQENMPEALVDEHSVYTILNNLVSNAIKYSYEDKFLGISLSSNEKNIILEVEDHGVGMEQKSLDHIFEKFYRIEDTLTAHTKGYGLGLSIVKNLVELNNGNIKVKSEKGSGTVFTVILPALIENVKTKKHGIANSKISGNGKQ